MGKAAGGAGRPVKRIRATGEYNLTSTERSAITAILNSGRTSGRVGRTDYVLSNKGNAYTAKIIRNDRGLGFIGSPLRRSTYTRTFTVER